MRAGMGLLVAVAALGFAGCGGLAAAQGSSSYSNATLSGNYALTASGIFQGGAGSYPFDLMATFHADGAGHITGGAVTEYLAGGLVCNAALTGGYTISPSGAGNAVLALGASPGVCASNTFAYLIAVNAAGTSVLFAESDQVAEVSGLAIRQ